MGFLLDNGTPGIYNKKYVGYLIHQNEFFIEDKEVHSLTWAGFWPLFFMKYKIINIEEQFLTISLFIPNKIVSTFLIFFSILILAPIIFWLLVPNMSFIYLFITPIATIFWLGAELINSLVNFKITKNEIKTEIQKRLSVRDYYEQGK